VQKYITLDGHVYGVDWFVINEKFFKSLPAELQYIVLDSAQISCVVGRGVQTFVASQGVQSLIDQKMVVYSPTEAEVEQFKKVAQQPVIDWLKTKIDQKLIEDILKNVDDVIAAQKQSIK
jgi:TRAP-type C4-dicarboxylate transport system substrate-binding protein